MTVWILLLQLATGDLVVINVPSEERCRYILGRVNQKGVIVHLNDGTALDVPKGGGVGCISEPEYEAQQAKKAGA